jgi:hypothetical protein
MSSISLPCPSCGTFSRLDEAYLQRFGGKTTSCAACGQRMVLPTLAELAAVDTDEITRLQQEALQPTEHELAQAIPQHGEELTPTSACRDGKILIVHNGVRLPKRCVKCSHPAGVSFQKTFNWRPGHEHVLSFLFGAIARNHMQKPRTATLGYSLCAWHQSMKIACRILGILAIIGGFGLFVVGTLAPREMFTGAVPVSFVTMLLGAISTAFGMSTLSVMKIDGRYVWLRGAGRPFLDTLPELPKLR